MNRQELQENYIQQLIEGMDFKTMECFVYDTLKENLSSYTDEELITEVEEYYPELIEGWLIMFKIRYFTPYQQQWREQSFSTLDEAKRMVEFYLSCGSPAELV